MNAHLRMLLFVLVAILAGSAGTLLVQRGFSDFDISRYVVFPRFDKIPPAHQPNTFDAELENAGIRGCANVFGALGDIMTDGARYEASTGWDKEGRYISATVALDFLTGTGSTKAVGIVFAASGRDGRCSGNFVRVFPIEADCTTFQQANLKDVKQRDDLAGLAVYDMPNGWEAILLPTRGACIVIATTNVSRG